MDRQKEFQDFEKLFWQISREMSYVWKKIYEQTFPGSQSHILFLLERSGPKRMSELAEILHLTPGAVTTSSDKLIEHGYITRLRNDKDRRVVHLDISEKGRSALSKLQKKGRKIIKSVFNDISNEELERMNHIFKRAATNIDNIEKEFDE